MLSGLSFSLAHATMRRPFFYGARGRNLRFIPHAPRPLRKRDRSLWLPCAALLLVVANAGCAKVGDEALLDEVRVERERDRRVAFTPGGAGTPVPEPDAPGGEPEPDGQPEPSGEPEPGAPPTCTEDSQCERLLCDCRDQPTVFFETCTAGTCAVASDCADNCFVNDDDRSIPLDEVAPTTACALLTAGADSCVACGSEWCCSDLHAYFTATDLPQYELCAASCGDDANCLTGCEGAYDAGEALIAFWQCTLDVCPSECQ